mgnify:FL=1|jgi:GNAT superfamily N-acetyltransferase
MGCCGSSILPQVELPELPPGVKHLTVNSSPALLDAVVDVATRSFCGSKTKAPEAACSWAFDPKASGEDPCGPLIEDPTAERLAYFRWSVTYMLAAALKHGGCFALVDGDGEDAKVVACALNFPPNDKHLHAPGICEQIALAGKADGKMPKCMEGKRMKALDSAMTAAHKAHAKGAHWYVQLFAVAPESQKQGHGNKLLEFINTLGDKSGVPVYLECVGKKIEAFYQKNGFVMKARYPVTGGNDTLDANGGLAAMVRNIQ